MRPPGRKRLPKVGEQQLGLARVTPVPVEACEQAHLGADTALARDDVAVGLGEMLSLLRQLGQVSRPLQARNPARLVLVKKTIDWHKFPAKSGCRLAMCNNRKNSGTNHGGCR